MFKTLKQIYTKLHSPSKQIQEDYEIIAKPIGNSETTFKTLGRVTDEYFQQIQKNISYMNHSQNYISSFQRLLEAGGWPLNAETSKASIHELINDAIDHNIPPAFLDYLYTNKRDLNCMVIGDPQIVNMYQQILAFYNQRNILKVFNISTEQFYQWFMKLWNNKLFRPQGRNIGCGELCLSLLTSAKKAKKGDIFYVGSSIEIKDNQALIAGSGAGFLYKTHSLIYNLMIQKNKNIFELLKRSPHIQTEFEKQIKVINDILMKKSSSKKNSEKIGYILNDLQKFLQAITVNSNTKEQNENILDAILGNEKGFKELKIKFSQLINTKQKIQDLNIKDMSELNSFISAIKKFQGISETDLTHLRLVQILFQSGLIDDIYKNNDLKTIQEILMLFRNYELSPQEQTKLKYHIEQVLSGRNQLTFDEFRRIIITINLYCYALKEHFDILLLTDSKTTNSIFINFLDTENSLNYIYEQLKKFNITTNLHTGRWKEGFTIIAS